MTGRYSRRILSIRNLSDVSKNHPFPEESEDGVEKFLERDESHSQWMCNRAFAERSDSFGYSDGCSMSSVSSWDEDEFDSEISQDVQQIFDDIDEILYEDKKHSAHKSQTFLECKEWLSKYPHLRIVGQQIVPENDPGFKVFAADSQRPRTVPPIFYGNTEAEGLALQGKSIEVLNPSLSQTHLGKGLHQMLQEVDEVIEQDGEYEELIAADYSDGTAINPDSFLVPMCPVVPEKQTERDHHDIIIDLLADRIWNEVLGWIRPLIGKYFRDVEVEDHEAFGDVKISSNLSDFIPFQENPSHLSAIRLSTAPSSTVRANELDDLLTISSKILQNSQVRQISSLPCTSNWRNLVNPKSNLISTATNQQLSGGKRAPSGRLAPLDQRSTRKQSAVSISNDGLLLNIKGISTPSIPNQSQWRKNFALPPIECLAQSQTKKLSNLQSHASRSKGKNSKIEPGIRPNTNPHSSKNDLSLRSPIPRPLTQWKDTKASLFRSQKHSPGINIQSWLSGDHHNTVKSKSSSFSSSKAKYVSNHEEHTESNE